MDSSSQGRPGFTERRRIMATTFSLPAGREHYWTTWIIECMTCVDFDTGSALKIADIDERLTKEQAVARARRHSENHDVRVIGLNIDWGVLAFGLP